MSPERSIQMHAEIMAVNALFGYLKRWNGSMDYDLGFFDKEAGRVEPGPNPLAPDQLLTMCQV